MSSLQVISKILFRLNSFESVKRLFRLTALSFLAKTAIFLFARPLPSLYSAGEIPLSQTIIPAIAPTITTTVLI